MKQKIVDFFAEHPKARIGVICAVLGVVIIWLAYAMDQSSKENLRKIRERKAAREGTAQVSFLGVREDVETIDKQEANNIVSVMNQRLNERESELEARETQQKEEVAGIHEQMAGLKTTVSRLENMLKVQKGMNPDVNQRNQNPTDIERRNWTPEQEAQYQQMMHQQQAAGPQRRVQPETYTEAPQRVGNVIRTISQSHIREISRNGEVSELELNEIRELSDAEKELAEAKEVEAKNRKEEKEKAREFTLAMGSIVSGTTLNGVAAPTAVGATENPIPVIMRVRKEAVMPNYFSLDIRDCHLLGSAVGDLASARVYIRAEGISCITNSGEAIEQNLTAYAVSSQDGMAGIKGEVVTRSNEMIANTMQAGFLSGFAEAAAPQRVGSVNTEPTTETLYQSANLNRFAGAGIMKGTSNALDRVAKYYMDMADSMWPVIEVLPGNEIDFVVQKGMTMKLEGSGTTRDDYYYD